jgi:hypothetical protein
LLWRELILDIMRWHRFADEGVTDNLRTANDSRPLYCAGGGLRLGWGLFCNVDASIETAFLIDNTGFETGNLNRRISSSVSGSF